MFIYFYTMLYYMPNKRLFGISRSYQMASDGNSIDIQNKYTPGSGGVGASSIANRRAKNRLATICGDKPANCFPYYMTLGQYNKSSGNPNGFIPFIPINTVNNNASTAPNAPTLNSLTPTSEHLILNFTLGSNGGSPITDIEYSTNNGGTWNSSGESSSPFAVIGLTNGTAYQVAVRAKNAVGTSPSSNVISGTPNPVLITFSTVATTSWTAPTGVTSVEYLVVGGGGGSGGGFDNGGGGGGGGGMVLNGTLSVSPDTSYTVTIGDGGAGGISIRNPVSQTNGSSGSSSVFDSITALGGGGGRASRIAPQRIGGDMVSGVTASTGGGGGGGGEGGGGGGGNTSDGSPSTLQTGGNGGAGISNSISGSSLTYGAGGRGANGSITPGNQGVPGAPNTGNGARGGGTAANAQTNGAKGGSGIIIIKY
jgi:hypothetical protein